MWFHVMTIILELLSMRRLLLTACALGLVLAACNGDTAADPTPTTTSSSAAAPTVTAPATPTRTPAPTPTPTPTPEVPADLSTIADDGEVTLAEAQAVLDVQTEIYNDAVIALLTRPDEVTGGVGQEFIEELSRIYGPQMTDVYAQIYGELASSGFEEANTQDPTGQTMTAETVVSSSDTCIGLLAVRDAGGLTVSGQPEPEQFEIAMKPIEEDEDTANPSGWKRTLESRNVGGDPCAT